MDLDRCCEPRGGCWHTCGDRCAELQNVLTEFVEVFGALAGVPGLAECECNLKTVFLKSTGLAEFLVGLCLELLPVLGADIFFDNATDVAVPHHDAIREH